MNEVMYLWFHKWYQYHSLRTAVVNQQSLAVQTPENRSEDKNITGKLPQFFVSYL
jgi:hypothetical protein